MVPVSLIAPVFILVPLDGQLSLTAMLTPLFILSTHPVPPELGNMSNLKAFRICKFLFRFGVAGCPTLSLTLVYRRLTVLLASLLLTCPCVFPSDRNYITGEIHC